MSTIINLKQVKNFFVLIMLCALATNCKNTANNFANDTKTINTTLEAWHVAAGKADFENYFKYFTDDAVFIGTDATENWNKKDFMVFSKPYFDKGKAWNFKSLERHIYFDATGNTAWFDELLDTQMKICRGSGVLTKQGDDWKIKQYVLSMTFPNAAIDSVLKFKSPPEDDLIKKLRSQ